METEKQIIERLKNCDLQAMEELMKIYQDYVFTLAYQIVKSYTIAEEITQDVFIKVFKKIDTYQARSKFSTWLYTITYRTGLNYLEKKKITFNMTEIENSQNGDGDSLNFFETVKSGYLEDDPDIKKILWDAIDTIPQMQGLVITLYYLQQFSVNDIAEMLNIPQNTIKINLFRGRKTLKELLLKKYKQEELL